MRLAIALTVLSLVPALTVPLSASANHLALPLAFTQTLADNGAFGLRVDADETGHFGVQITACGTRGDEGAASTNGVGVLQFDAARAFQFGVGITGHFSPDRRIVQVGPAGDRVTIGFAFPPICPITRLEFDVQVAPGATRYYAAWSAGLDQATTKIDVFGGPDTRVAVTTGDAYARGDPEMEGGFAQAQVQHRYQGFNGVGAKAMLLASTTLDVRDALHGFWGHGGTKFVCAGQCVDAATVDQTCAQTLDVTCTSGISWSGPNGAGGSGQQSYSILGGAAGEYTFTVDRKVDAYDPGGGKTVGPAFVYATENYSYLNAADVALPA